MKQSTSNILNLTTLLVFLFCLISCEDISSDVGGPYAGIPLTKSQETVCSMTNDFSLKLFGRMVDGSENVFISPMGVTMLNMMLANGASGETYNEIVNTLGFGTLSLNQINDYYQLMSQSLMRADKLVSLSLPNSMWIAKGHSVKTPFKQTIDKAYDADLYTVDFGKKSAVNKINEWCNTKTCGLIPKFVETVDGNTVLMLINALYFQGEWMTKFKVEADFQGDFNCIDGTKTPVTYMGMWSKSLLGYADEEVLDVRMRYGNGAFYMEAILPLTDDFLGFVNSLDMSKLVKWGQNTTQAIELHFPKMDLTFDSGISGMTEALKGLGIRRPFSPGADFSGITDDPVYVSSIQQKARILVDEEGTRAVAVTGEKLYSAGPDYWELVATPMFFDRPFIFLIRESSTGSILFMGAKVK